MVNSPRAKQTRLVRYLILVNDVWRQIKPRNVENSLGFPFDQLRNLVAVGFNAFVLLVATASWKALRKLKQWLFPTL